MVKSMTGYGRCENEAEGRKFSVEIKSVNHRYNDISIRLPRTMNYLEDKIRKTLMKKIMRGKTDVYINFESFADDDVNIKVNDALASAYCEKLNYLRTKYGLTCVDTLDLVAKFPDVITVEKVQDDEDAIWNILLPALEGAYLRTKYGLTCVDTLDLVAKFPDVITVEKVQDDEDAIWNILLPALEGALDNFISMREVEGEALKEDILNKAKTYLIKPQ